MQLNYDQECTVINALYTAAEKYRECAKAVGAEEAMSLEARKSLVAQFEKQAVDCSLLAEKLEG